MAGIGHHTRLFSQNNDNDDDDDDDNFRSRGPFLEIPGNFSGP